MEPSELLARIIFQAWYFVDFPHVSLMYDTWTVVSSPERINGLLVLVTGVREALNYILGLAIFQGVAKVD